MHVVHGLQLTDGVCAGACADVEAIKETHVQNLLSEKQFRIRGKQTAIRLGAAIAS